MHFSALTEHIGVLINSSNIRTISYCFIKVGLNRFERNGVVDFFDTKKNDPISTSNSKTRKVNREFCDPWANFFRLTPHFLKIIENRKETKPIFSCWRVGTTVLILFLKEKFAMFSASAENKRFWISVKLENFAWTGKLQSDSGPCGDHWWWSCKSVFNYQKNNKYFKNLNFSESDACNRVYKRKPCCAIFFVIQNNQFSIFSWFPIFTNFIFLLFYIMTISFSYVYTLNVWKSPFNSQPSHFKLGQFKPDRTKDKTCL